jgi:ATP-dependent Zn protease
MRDARKNTVEANRADKTPGTSASKHPLLRRLAARAMGMTGADIERIVREARLKARRERRALSMADLEDGVRLSRPAQTPETLFLRAVHETGHALVHHVLGIGPILGMTVDSENGAYGNLGFSTDRLHTDVRGEDTLTMLMAGRAAEIVVFGFPGPGSGGASNSDIARATSLALSVERTWGVGDDLPLLYRPAKDETAVLDQDRELATRIHERLERAEARAIEIIDRHRAALDALAVALADAQALEGADVVQILEDAGARRAPP